MKNLSLFKKFFLSIFFVIAMFSALMVLLVNFYIRDTLFNEDVEDGRALVATIATTVSEHLANDDPSLTAKDFDRIISTNSEVQYLSVIRSGDIMLTRSRGLSDTNIPPDISSSGEKDFAVVSLGRIRVIDFSAAIPDGKGSILRVGIAERLGEKAITHIVVSILIASIIVMVFASFVVFLLAKRLIRPLSELTSSALLISDGHYEKTVSVTGSDEVGRLADAFNRMTEAVRTREKELRDVNEELETVNIRLYDYIAELKKTREELVKSKQDSAVVDTSRTFLHHIRQPLTFLIMAVEMLTEEINAGETNLRSDAILRRIQTIEHAAFRMSDLLKKFEKINQYRTVEFDDRTKIIDIDN